jgi:hypothetical protein
MTGCGTKEAGNQKYSQLSIRIEQALNRSTQINYLAVYKKTGVKPVVLILFPGGDGTCHFGDSLSRSSCGKNSSNSIDLGSGIWVSYNFLARNVREFALRGHVVLLVDMPDDVKNKFSSSSEDPKIIASAYRTGGDWDGDSLNNPADIVGDLSSVIADAERKLGLVFTGVYLVGTSRGTLASAYLSHKLSSQPVSGVVLTATLSSDANFSSYCPGGVNNFTSCTSVNSYTGKLLMVHHKYDGCSASMYSDANSIFSSLSASPKTFVTVQGGVNLSSNPCKAKTYHGFYGRDSDVVGLILDWIEGKSVPSDI